MSEAWDEVKAIYEEAKGLVPRSERAAADLVLAWSIMELVKLQPQDMLESFLRRIQKEDSGGTDHPIPKSIRDKLIPHREVFSERVANVFLREEILTWGNLCDFGKDDIVQFKNFGETCLTDVRRVLRQRGLFLRGEEPSVVGEEFIEEG